MQSYNYLSTKLVAAQRTATALLKAYFASVPTTGVQVPRMLISTPTYSVTSENVVVSLFYYAAQRTGNNTKLHVTDFNYSSAVNMPVAGRSVNSLNSLVSALSRLFTTSNSVPVQLRIVRLAQPYLNSSILAQYLAINASKYGFTRLRHYVLSTIPLNSSSPTMPIILGVKVQISGLLTTQRMAPRKTVSTVSAGTFHGPNSHLDYSSHTSKSTLGSYTVKVWLCTR